MINCWSQKAWLKLCFHLDKSSKSIPTCKTKSTLIHFVSNHMDHLDKTIVFPTSARDEKNDAGDITWRCFHVWEDYICFFTKFKENKYCGHHWLEDSGRQLCQQCSSWCIITYNVSIAFHRYITSEGFCLSASHCLHKSPLSHSLRHFLYLAFLCFFSVIPSGLCLCDASICSEPCSSLAQQHYTWQALSLSFLQGDLVKIAWESWMSSFTAKHHIPSASTSTHTVCLFRTFRQHFICIQIKWSTITLI